MSRIVSCSVFLLGVMAVIGCGGKSSSKTNTNPPMPSSNPVNSPMTITLAAGQSMQGIDIVVPAPSSNPAPNAQVLGVTTGSGGTASNTGATVTRGSTVTVLLFGPGLSGNMQVSISGPADIGISNIRSIQSTTNIPGVAFQAVVPDSAAVGARTVVLQTSNGDITTFTGGLEVQ